VLSGAPDRRTLRVGLRRAGAAGDRFQPAALNP
jgi:hypothetical protein